MIVVTYSGCNENVRQAIAALADSNLLYAFHTTLSFKEQDALLKLVPAQLRAELLRRQFPCDAEKIYSHPFSEALRLVAVRLKWRGITKQEAVLGPTTIGIELDRQASRFIEENAKSISGVFGYEDASLFSFKVAQERNMSRLYELTTPYWQTAWQICKEEADRLPQWAHTIDSVNSTPALRERKTKEVELADRILCISKYVQKSLPKQAQAKSEVVSYGFPVRPGVELKQRKPDGALKVLFVGNLTQRKGLGDLFEAMKLLKRKDVRLICLGSMVAPEEFYRSQYRDFEYHSPLPHQQVLDFMSTCDVLAFPALCEGRGLVQLEAMSVGLPVIGTINATSDDLIDDGVDGFIVPIRSPESIAEKISWLADHPDERLEMGRRAAEKSKTISWERYRQQIVDAVAEAARNR